MCILSILSSAIIALDLLYTNKTTYTTSLFLTVAAPHKLVSTYNLFWGKMSPQYPGESDSQPDRQCATHRRSNQSAAGHIWEIGLWLEITFFSFLFSCLSPSTCLPSCFTPHVFYVCCHRSIATPGAQSRQTQWAVCFFKYTETCAPTNTHKHTNTCTDWLTASFWETDESHSTSVKDNSLGHFCL